MARIFISYQHVGPDAAVAEALFQGLTEAGHQVLLAEMPEPEMRPEVDVLVVLLSAQSVRSQTVMAEVAAAVRFEKRILPVRVAFHEELGITLAAHLNPLQSVFWEGPDTTERVVRDVVQALQPAPELPGVEYPRDREARWSGAMRGAWSVLRTMNRHWGVDLLAAILIDALRVGSDKGSANVLLKTLHASSPMEVSERLGTWLPDPSIGRPGWDALGPEMETLIAFAIRVRNDTGQLVGAKTERHHMLIALLSPLHEHDSAAQALQKAGVDLERLRSELAWVIGPEAVKWLVPAPEIAGYTSDTPEGEDLLGIAKDVNALCAVIAARSLSPPLSIGLFGDWGTGKSFFMAKMRERLAKLARGNRDVYVSRIAQVTFNPWHYADGNLWASLTATIFEGLAKFGAEEGNAGVRDKLQQELASANLLHDSAQSELVEAQLVRQNARTALDEAHANSDKLIRELGNDEELVKGLAEVAADAEARKSVDRLVPESLRGKLTPAALLEAIHQARLLGGRIRGAWRWLRQEPKRAVRALLFVAAISGLFVAVASQLDFWTPVVRQAVAFLTGPASVAVTVLAIVKQALSKVEAVKKTLDGATEKRLSGLQTRYEQARAAEEAAQKRKDTADAKVEAIKRKLEKPRPDAQLKDFLSERHASADYRGQLGLMTLIRNDFARLSALLQDAAKAEREGLPVVDRIVLYVDDLDRCPEERVVEVLEAVHLLLAFPLFVVVVGVDSRWLIHALRKRYAAFQADGAATPTAYLEKIFQLPFTLERMDRPGFERLMASMFQTTSEPAAPGPAARARAPEVAPPAAPAVMAAVEPPVPPAPPLPSVDIPSEQLKLRPDELRYLQGLQALIPSPRAARRLANCYRLLRARVSRSRWAAFIGTTGTAPRYRLAMSLMAAMVGYPEAYAELVNDLEQAGHPWPGSAAQRLLDLLNATGARDEILAAPPEVLQDWTSVVRRFSYHLREGA